MKDPSQMVAPQVTIPQRSRLVVTSRMSISQMLSRLSTPCDSISEMSISQMVATPRVSISQMQQCQRRECMRKNDTHKPRQRPKKRCVCNASASYLARPRSRDAPQRPFASDSSLGSLANGKYISGEFVVSRWRRLCCDALTPGGGQRERERVLSLIHI